MTACDALSALSPGAPLWMIPPLDQSSWSTRIDWYLGFQIRRAWSHKRFEFSETMHHLLEAYEEKVPKVPSTGGQPLMIASANLLPNHQTVLVPAGEGDASLTDWVKSCHRVWLGLDKPAARVFLPKSLSLTAFEKAWPRQDAGASLQVVAGL